MSRAETEPAPRPLILEAAYPVDVDLPALRHLSGPAVAFFDSDGGSDILLFRKLHSREAGDIEVPYSQMRQAEHTFNIARGVKTDRMFRITYGIGAPGAPVPDPGTTRCLLLTHHLIAPVVCANGIFLPTDAGKIHRAQTAGIPQGPVIAFFERHHGAQSTSAHQKMAQAELLKPEIDLAFETIGMVNTQGVVFC